MTVGPHGQGDGLEYEAAPPCPPIHCGCGEPAVLARAWAHAWGPEVTYHCAEHADAPKPRLAHEWTLPLIGRWTP